MLSARNVEQGRIVIDDFRYISDEAFVTENARTRVAPGDVLLTIVGTIGRSAVVPQGIGPFALQRSVAVLSPVSDLDSRFLSYQLQSPRIQRHFEAHARGTAQKGVYLKTLGETPLVLPGLDEQRKIVAEIEKQFSRLDDAVANLQRVKANLRRYTGAVLQSVTSGQLEIEGLGSRKRAEVGGWRRLTIEELASREPRSIQSGPFGSNLLHSEFQASGKLVIGIDNVQDGAYSIGANHRISESKFAELEKYRARPQDVLITVMATVGRVCVLPENIEPAIITKHVYRITVDRAVASPEYVGIALRGARDVRAQLLGSVQGQTRPGLNGTLIKRIRVPIPPLAEQHRIVAEVDRRLSIVREVEVEVDANLKRAQALRQAVLQRAFSPRMADQPLVDERLHQLHLVPGTTTLIESARVALSAELVHQLHSQPSFGQVKHQKLFHLAEHIAKIESLHVRYRRAGFGPLNLDVIKASERALERLGWYAERPRQGSDGHCYVPLSNAGRHTEYLQCFADDQLTFIRRLVTLMREWKTEECEMFSTTYAAWNDLIIMRREATPDAILHEVLELWDTKKKRFTRQQWLDTIAKIERHGFAPTGFGQLTRSPNDGVTPDFFDDK